MEDIISSYMMPCSPIQIQGHSEERTASVFRIEEKPNEGTRRKQAAGKEKRTKENIFILARKNHMVYTQNTE
jgi:hypothetical protein